MVLIEATYFFKTRKEESKKIFAKIFTPIQRRLPGKRLPDHRQTLRAGAVSDPGRDGSSDQRGAGAGPQARR